jgi:2-succinyl-6-hydroxy-2,4-cyclohexadiene-1-carboxylate synthase
MVAANERRAAMRGCGLPASGAVLQAWRAVRLHGERSGTGPRMVLLHGFAQTCRCWGPLATDLARDHEVLRLDAPGHGGSSHVRATLSETAQLIADTGGRGSYLGYSMGARMALHVALARPDLVHRLILIGGTPGIEDAGERAARHQRDRDLAQRIRQVGVDAFVREWLELPMFAGLPAQARFDGERRANTADGLASSLELAGAGAQASLWPDLGKLGMPVLLIAGDADDRYAAIAERMAHAIGANAEAVRIPGAGHAAHLEQPDHVVAVLRTWLA